MESSEYLLKDEALLVSESMEKVTAVQLTLEFDSQRMLKNVNAKDFNELDVIIELDAKFIDLEIAVTDKFKGIEDCINQGNDDNDMDNYIEVGQKAEGTSFTIEVEVEVGNSIILMVVQIHSFC